MATEPGRYDDVTVGDVERLLDELFPFAWAEPWDRSGLLVGDPSTVVSRILVTLDPTHQALSLAAAHGANVLVTHHPVFLEPPAVLSPGYGSAGVAFEAASLGIALLNCHTNLDRAPAGADSLPLAVGLTPGEPLEKGRQPAALVTVYVPDAALPRVLDAMVGAGAGRIGEYRGCAFTDPGVGSFVPGEGTHPVLGKVGERSSAEETRLEMTCDPSAVGRVVAAARRTHPYEEPLIVIADVAVDRGSARLGRLCELPAPQTLRAFASRVGESLSVTPRVWGEPEREVRLVATNSGSGGAMLGAAIGAGASVLLTGEVRYHVALEALAAGIAVIEAGHDATEWPHVEVLARGLRTHPALADSVATDAPTRRWWTP